MSTAMTEITTMGTVRAFTRDACSGTLMSVLNRAYGQPLQLEQRASNPLAGGVVQHGYQCGMLWGAALAAGAQAYRLFGPGPRAEAAAVAASRRLVQSFGASNQQINCLELTDTDMQQTAGVLKYLFKGGPISCGRMAVRFSPLALNEINAALAEDPATVPASCASCAATTARQMGASELHAVMAAGLAGGIGLSGGCCGALGAAIWITGINHPEEKIGLSADDTRVGELLEAFVASADHRFECAEIVGRRFAGVNDHARYLRGGGCSELIRTMALTSNPDGHGRSDQLLA